MACELTSTVAGGSDGGPLWRSFSRAVALEPGSWPWLGVGDCGQGLSRSSVAVVSGGRVAVRARTQAHVSTAIVILASLVGPILIVESSPCLGRGLI